LSDSLQNTEGGGVISLKREEGDGPWKGDLWGDQREGSTWNEVLSCRVADDPESGPYLPWEV